MTGSPPHDLGALADPHEYHEPIDIEGAEATDLVAWLDSMIRIRRVEEAVGEMVRTGEARCPCHLAIGQEACAVGVVAAIEEGDVAFGAHRSHAHYLALGGSPMRLLAEILGRDSGCSRGLGGSMHLTESSIGLMGTVPIVSATIPIAVGAAMAARMTGGRRMAVSFFGDGATEEGAFHESLNLAIMQGAPVLFVCENNLFSSHLHISQRQPFDSVARFAEAHGLHWLVVDGNDVVAVRNAAVELAEEARAGRPAFLEAVTYRWRGHVGHREDLDVGVDRNADLPIWKKRDPIGRLESALRAADIIDDADLARINDATREQVEAALDQARAAPYPPEELLLEAVYPRGAES